MKSISWKLSNSRMRKTAQKSMHSYFFPMQNSNTESYISIRYGLQTWCCPPSSLHSPSLPPLKSIAAEEARARLSMTSVPAVLAGSFAAAVRAAFPGMKQLKALVQASSGGKFGDYKCNVAMAISQVKKTLNMDVTPWTPFSPPSLHPTLQTLKSQGQKMSPQDVAAAVLANLGSTSTVMEKVTSLLSLPLTLSLILFHSV